jgi:spoIIIJ-associated protein
MLPEQTEIIKNILQQLLQVMDFEGDTFVDSSDAMFLRFNIQSSQAAYLIGRGGETLRGLQEIVRVISSKKCGEPARFIIDVNDYQKERLESIREAARSLAAEAAQGQTRWLPPMNAYERRVVHLALAGFEGIKTESEGEGDQRRVVIKPAAS